MTAWPLFPLHKIVQPAERWETPVDGIRYRQLGVRLWGEGAYERAPIDGSETKYAKLNRVEAGDLVVNKIWARNGSVAVVPDSLGGCYVSGEFPTFAPCSTKVESRWLHWATKTKPFWNQCDEKSRGTSGKNRIRPEEFLSVVLPLPPLDEQERIITRIELLARKHTDVLRLRQESELELHALCRSLLFSNSGSSSVRMADLVSLRQTDTKVEPQNSYSFAGVFCFGKGVFKGATKTGAQFAYDRLTKVHAGEFTYPKLMAWEGALGVVPAECNGLFVSPEYPVFTIKSDQVLPEVVDTYFRTPSVWPILAGASTGTNVRRRRLHPSAFLKLVMPVPPMAVQHKIKKARQAFEDVSRIRRDSEDEVKQLLSAVLDSAFSGPDGT